ncbi:response regulator [Altibacter sp. HG106]|uniref:response regulator n=1 Tax=Altibacter sp. HG106 TaxID=3023937 RepID=UPI00235100F4|nr:response regulator [Altibacter sp. HG106]MDC7995432.1 response regulator [Altibacter sp. HG106]
MKPNDCNVLLIDDHPLILEAYKNALNRIEQTLEKHRFHIDIASDCDTAYRKITTVPKTTSIDLIFLDMRLPPSQDGKILSGEDLGLIIKKTLPNSKIIVSTTHTDNYRIHSIFKSIDPDGFLIKNDISPDDIILAIEQVLEDPPFYSKTVIKLLRKNVSNDFLLDNIDRKLLYELSLGTKMKDLPDILPLSIAGIEKRKRNLKEIFDVASGDDKELISKAKDKGFI